MRYSCCPLTDGDADVWKDRGAVFENLFSVRDPLWKSTNAPAELLESTLIATEDHVSQTRTHAGKISFRQKKDNTRARSPPVSFAQLCDPVDVPQSRSRNKSDKASKTGTKKRPDCKNQAGKTSRIRAKIQTTSRVISNAQENPTLRLSATAQNRMKNT